MTSRRKWVLFAVLALSTVAFCVFLGTAGTKAQPPAPPSAAMIQAPQESPDHELKSLAMHLQKKPGHTPVLMRMAALERENGRYAEAAGHLRDVLKVEPANTDARVELGRALYESGDIAGAITETERALASKPRQVDALYNLGAIYANLGNDERARMYWTRALAADSAAESGAKARDGLAKLAAPERRR